jgi:hypothetical protein
MRLWFYRLMPNPGYLVVGPERDRTLSRFVGWLSLTHTQRRHAYRGTVGSGSGISAARYLPSIIPCVPVSGCLVNKQTPAQKREPGEPFESGSHASGRIHQGIRFIRAAALNIERIRLVIPTRSLSLFHP